MNRPTTIHTAGAGDWIITIQPGELGTPVMGFGLSFPEALGNVLAAARANGLPVEPSDSLVGLAVRGVVALERIASASERRAVDASPAGMMASLADLLPSILKPPANEKPPSIEPAGGMSQADIDALFDAEAYPELAECTCDADLDPRCPVHRARPATVPPIGLPR